MISPAAARYIYQPSVLPMEAFHSFVTPAPRSTTSIAERSSPYLQYQDSTPGHPMVRSVPHNHPNYPRAPDGQVSPSQPSELPPCTQSMVRSIPHNHPTTPGHPMVRSVPHNHPSYLGHPMVRSVPHNHPSYPPRHCGRGGGTVRLVIQQQ